VATLNPFMQPFAHPVQVAIDTVTLAVQTIIDTVADAIQVSCPLFMTIGCSLVSPTIQAVIDAITFIIQVPLYAIALAVKMVFDALVGLRSQYRPGSNGAYQYGHQAQGFHFHHFYSCVVLVKVFVFTMFNAGANRRLTERRQKSCGI